MPPRGYPCCHSTRASTNFGCPAPKVTGSGSGSALMKTLRAVSNIRAVRKATAKPLSVKMRIGWDSNHINAVDFAKMCEAAGADSLQRAWAHAAAAVCRAG